MCTATWARTAEGYELLFNRDELKSRAEALPPRAFEREGVRWLAPVDPDEGGTWIAANDRGLTVAILNGNRAADDADREWTSRGALVASLAAETGAAAVAERLRAADLDPYRSFRLLALDPGAPALVAEWDRRTLRLDVDAEERVPLISSSFDETAVAARRRAEFERRFGAPGGRPRPGPEELLAYHRSARGGADPYTVSMERPDAATRSLVRVAVEARAVTMRYHPGRPDLPAPESVARLERATRPAANDPESS